jgi:uncharacterized cupin superfamily protein
MHPEAHPLVSSPLVDAPCAPAGSDLVLVEWTDAGGGAEPPDYLAPRHLHQADDEAFYILEGSLAFELAGRTVRVDAGGAVMIPKNTIHTWWNPTSQPCRYLILMTRRIHELIGALHAPDRTRSLADVFRDHQSELIDVP